MEIAICVLTGLVCLIAGANLGMWYMNNTWERTMRIRRPSTKR